MIGITSSNRSCEQRPHPFGLMLGIGRGPPHSDLGESQFSDAVGDLRHRKQRRPDAKAIGSEPPRQQQGDNHTQREVEYARDDLHHHVDGDAPRPDQDRLGHRLAAIVIAAHEHEHASGSSCESIGGAGRTTVAPHEPASAPDRGVSLRLQGFSGWGSTLSPQ